MNSQSQQGAQNQNQTATQQTDQKEWVTDSRTRGRVVGLGLELVAVRTDQDAEGKVLVEELLGNDAGRKVDVQASAVQRISNKPGTAQKEYPKFAQNGAESTLDMARRLAGDTPRQSRQDSNGGQRQDNPYVYSGNKPFGASTKVTLKPDGHYYLQITRNDQKEGLEDVQPRFTRVRRKSETATRQGKEIPGLMHSLEEYRIEFGNSNSGENSDS